MTVTLGNMYVKWAGKRTWVCWVSVISRCCWWWSRVPLCSGPGWSPPVPQSFPAVWQKVRGLTWTLCSASGSPDVPIGETIKSCVYFFTYDQEGEENNWRKEILLDKPVGTSATIWGSLLPPSVALELKHPFNFVPVLHVKFNTNTTLLHFVELAERIK